jgi:glycosyltransferase involved in cell wall biosynthesis
VTPSTLHERAEAHAPTVSVIIPCYNGSRYLRETLESVQAQSRPSLEVIVIDDGSTDDSAAIAESFDSSVRVIRQANQGESVARNRGIAEARGTYCMFLDADDLLHEQALEKLIAASGEDRAAVLMMGCAAFVDDPANIMKWFPACVDGFFEGVMAGNRGLPHSYLTPTDLVRKVGGFNQHIRFGEDWDFWCKVACTRPRVIAVDFTGAYYRTHPNSQSRNADPKAKRRDHVAIVEGMIARMAPNQDLVTAHGEAAFWFGWAMLAGALDLDIPWRELELLRTRLEWLAKNGPATLRASRFVRLSRLLGLRGAMCLQRCMGRERLSIGDSTKIGEA